MADNAELIQALHEHAKALDFNSKAGYLNWLAQQKLLARSTPTTALFGSYGFGGNANILAAWRQIVPRNIRRRRITITSLNQTLYLSHSETELSITDLINWQNLGFGGRIPVSQVTFATGQGLQIETSEAIYIASITGSGSKVEQTCTVNWVEEIFSSVDAIPGTDPTPMKHNMPFQEQRTFPGLTDIDGEVTAQYNRDGVR